MALSLCNGTKYLGKDKSVHLRYQNRNSNNKWIFINITYLDFFQHNI